MSQKTVDGLFLKTQKRDLRCTWAEISHTSLGLVLPRAIFTSPVLLESLRAL